MNEIFARVKNLIVSPKTEWEKISQEENDVKTIAVYLLILALIPAVCTFIGYSVFGYKVPFMGYVGSSVSMAIRQALVSYVSSLIGAALAAVVINLLAPSFSSQQNGGRVFALVVYSYVPMYVAGVLMILPSLAPITLIAGLYGLYLLYLGLPVMMQTPEEKHTSYFVVSLIVMIVASIVLSMILTPLFIGSVYY